MRVFINNMVLFLGLALSCNWVLAQSKEGEAPAVCGFNQQAVELAKMIIHHPNQQRTEIQCNTELAQIAQQRAEHLAKNLSDPNISPNQILIKAGFRFPSYYPVSGNQVEAVAKQPDSSAAANYFTSSPKYKYHVLGDDEFFMLQNQIAVGYYSDDNPLNHDQWVVLIAEPWQSPKIVFKQEFNMPFRVAQGCEKDWQNSNDEFLKSKCSRLGRAK